MAQGLGFRVIWLRVWGYRRVIGYRVLGFDGHGVQGYAA